MSPDECSRRYVGWSMSDVAEDIARHHAIDILSDLRDRWIALLLRAADGQLPCVEGCPECLAKLSVPLACASNSSAEELCLKLESSGLARHFGRHVYSAPHLGRPKPAPDVYLHAARALGFDPTEVIVVEDSHSGVLAARAAGAHVIGFAGAGHAEASLPEALLAAGAECVVHCWPALIDLLLSRLADRD